VVVVDVAMHRVMMLRIPMVIIGERRRGKGRGEQEASQKTRHRRSPVNGRERNCRAGDGGL